MILDYRNGKIIWNNLERIISGETLHLSEDLLQVHYRDYVVDVGWYKPYFIITIVNKVDDEEKMLENWAHPFAQISCYNIDDLQIQLQKVINGML